MHRIIPPPPCPIPLLPNSWKVPELFADDYLTPRLHTTLSFPSRFPERAADTLKFATSLPSPPPQFFLSLRPSPSAACVPCLPTVLHPRYTWPSSAFRGIYPWCLLLPFLLLLLLFHSIVLRTGMGIAPLGNAFPPPPPFVRVSSSWRRRRWLSAAKNAARYTLDASSQSQLFDGLHKAAAFPSYGKNKIFFKLWCLISHKGINYLSRCEKSLLCPLKTKYCFSQWNKCIWILFVKYLKI